MSDDFLAIDGANEQRSFQLAEGRRIALLYTLFETDQRGRDLLKLWDESLLNRRTPVDAAITTYAANEALRAFIAGIHTQIQIAKQAP